MTAVANPPSFQQNSRSAWSANISQGGLTAMNADEVARMFMPRKSAQRANSSSSIASNSSSSSTSTTVAPTPPQLNGVPMSSASSAESNGWGTAAARKKNQRAGPWPTNKAEPMTGQVAARPQSVLNTNGTPTSSSMTSIHQPSPMVPSQHSLQNPSQQANGSRPPAQPVGEAHPVLCLLSMNGTFERKSISVPFYPDSLRIGRQTNAKTVPTPSNGFFDSKVLSRQHAEIWAERNGKIWIRDVKSSNGTFVNGARLSAENRDSEPHELQSQDHLELGIDIVSEDQKTVVHHKVAAKIEHAGFLGATNNVLEMNFGDLDPANGALMVPSQGSLQMRGRAGSQGSVSSNGRMGPPTSLAGSQTSALSQQRPMNFWLTPVTTEQIVKRLTHEMRTARLLTNDLGRTDMFFGSLLSKENIKDANHGPVVEHAKGPEVNGGSISSFRSDGKARFSDPPAPPPQQPLPEKPDVARSHGVDSSSPSLKRNNTERPRSVTTVSPTRQEPVSQIVSLVEALASAKKEIDTQSARMRDLEEMLRKEKQAREFAEEVAKRLELESEVKRESPISNVAQGSIVEEAFDPPSEIIEAPVEKAVNSILDEKAPVPEPANDPTALLEKRLEAMVLDMQILKSQMEQYKLRAEKAETERDTDRKTLAEMVEKIRIEDLARKASLAENQVSSVIPTIERQPEPGTGKVEPRDTKPLSEKTNGHALVSSTKAEPVLAPEVAMLPRPPGGLLYYHGAPYASVLGVVLIGMGVMAYLNGWQTAKIQS